MNERSAVIRIGNTDYELLLTTKATKDIAKRYGGLDKLGQNLMQNENFEEALAEVVWLITELANQPILIYNYENPEQPKRLLTEEEVELLTTPKDLSDFKTAISEALYFGAKRNIESEETETKNAQNG